MAVRGVGERVYPNGEWEGLFGLVFIGGGLAIFAYNPGRYLAPTSFSAFGGLALIMGMFGMGMYALVQGAVAMLSSVRLYDGGLVVHFGPQRSDANWNQVVAVTGGIPLRDRGRPIGAGKCWLELEDGRRVAVPRTVKNFPELVERIQAAVLARLQPDAEQDLRTGAELTFGPIVLRADGVRANGRFVPWTDSVEVAFPQRGTGFISNAPATLALFTARETEPWVNVPIGSVPNAHLFLTLARVFAREAGHEFRLIRHYSLDLAFAPLTVGSADPPPAPRPRPPAPAASTPEPAPEPVPLDPSLVPLSRHAVTWWSAVLQSQTVAAACFALSLLCLFVLIVGGVANLFDRYERAVYLLYLLIPIAALGLVGSALGWWQVMEVVVSAEGLTLARRGRTRQRAWEEVAEVYIDETLLNGARISICRVVFTDRRKLKLDMSLSNYDVFLRSVQRAVTLVKLPEARRALEDGKELAFGPVRISATGVGVRKDWVKWEYLDRAYIGDGHLVVRPQGASGRKCPLSEIPNYLVLLNLIHDRAGDRFEGFN